MASRFEKVGRKTGTIPVRISYRIIDLFSEGLYSSPSKAVEELVSNSYDAGASNVQVVVKGIGTDVSEIVVIDDGIGMSRQGFAQHWLVGVSNKREEGFTPPKGRRQIGKFGIGKLATYVLASRLTHVSKRNGKIHSVTMDFRRVPKADADGVFAKDPVDLELRELTEDEARDLVQPYLTGDDVDLKALKLFGRNAKPSWTVAVMSDLKPMATELRLGRLRWVLSTAMPLRDDFKLFLNGTEVEASKLKAKKVGRWELGRDVTHLPTPAPDTSEPDGDGLIYPKIGRVSGYIEAFAEPIDSGKSEDVDRSNGFFVYVLGRLVNVDDPGFGIDRNKLRHGTFSRFRMVLNVDALDEELRSSREMLREGVLTNIARAIAHGGFNFARAKLTAFDEKDDPASQVARRVAASPPSLTRRPLIAEVRAAFIGHYVPRYLTIPTEFNKEQRAALIDELADEEARPELVRGVELTDLRQDQAFAVFDVGSGLLRINTRHPFVAYFLDDYEVGRRSVPLELIAMSEVLLEAQLLEAGADHETIANALGQRDQLLRHLARATGQRNAAMVAQDLLDAVLDQSRLESEAVASFDSMGFDAIPLGGNNRADGVAEAHLSKKSEKRQGYAVSLEAKSKERKGVKVTAHAVGVSRVARHRDDLSAKHAIVVGPDFPTKDEAAALVKELRADRKKSDATITLIRVEDLARLVRLVPLKRIGLDRLRTMLETCITPDETRSWIDAIAGEVTPRPPYRDVLETIHEEQEQQPDELVEFSALRTSLRIKRKVELSNDELANLCRALARMVPEWVTVHPTSVELTQRPDKILDAVRSVIQQSPDRKPTDVPK